MIYGKRFRINLNGNGSQKGDEMSKRIDFEIEFQKEIDRCKHKMAIHAANGSIANNIVSIMKNKIEKAESAKLTNDSCEMVILYHELKSLRS